MSISTVLVCIFVLAYFFYGLQPASIAGEERTVSIKISKGDSFKNIAARLSQESLITSIAVFKVYALISGKAQKFQPGAYELMTSMSVPSIVRTLTTSGAHEVTITIPEGSVLKDIDAVLSEAGVIKSGEINDYVIPESYAATKYPFLAGISSLEGFLFPDTYRFELESSVDDVVAALLDTFAKKAWPILEGQNEWYGTLILASILEREVPEFTDRQIVAGILLKRLSLGIPLQVDASLSYAKCGGAIKSCEEIEVARSDLALASPYNTYQHLGLTPTPISNPGQAALRAAREPQSSPYLYYLSASKTHETMFSKTLQEHNIKRAKYL